MKRKSGLILLAVFVGLLAVAGVLDDVKVGQELHTRQAVSPENGDVLRNTEGIRQCHDANISTSVPYVASPEFHSPVYGNGFAGRNDFRSLHKTPGFISFRAGKQLNSRVLMLNAEKLQLLPFGSTDPGRSFIRLGRLII